MTRHAHLLKEQMAQSTDLIDIMHVTFAPRVINVDKNASYPKAITELNVVGALPDHVELRQVK